MMTNPQIKQIEDKIARLQVQLEYLMKIEKLKKEQTESNHSQNSVQED